jgi:hypothetical protein
MTQIMNEQDIINIFEEESERQGKLFLENAGDDRTIRSLLNYYTKYQTVKLLVDCIKYYIKTTDEPILIYNFALVSSNIRDYLTHEQNAKDEINRLIKETEERMKAFGEL